MSAQLAPRYDEAVAALLDKLRARIAPSPVGLPEPDVAVLSLAERTVGLGGHRGSEIINSFGVTVLKGVRVEGQVRFELWRSDLAASAPAAAQLVADLLGAHDELWNLGLLRLTLDGVPEAFEAPSAGGWRQDVLYRVLYEHQYEDADDGAGLIARVEIDLDPETRDSLQRESMAVTDELVRWDEHTAPSLRVRGRLSVSAVSALTFLPAIPTGTVSFTRTFDGASGPPAAFASFAPFLDAVAGPDPLARHATVSFAGVQSFLDALGPALEPVELGDWDLDGVPDEYVSRSLRVDPAIELAGAGDRLEIAYSAAALDAVAVVYVRASRTVIRG